jgi:hypothetical protein
MNRRRLLSLLLLAGSAFAGQGTAPPLRILFVGNSYTFYNDLPQTLARLAGSAQEPIRIETDRVVVGGATLQRHWSDGLAVNAIRRGIWDFVVLQEQSLLGANLGNAAERVAAPTAFFEFSRLFNAEIRRTKARTVFFATWARQSRPELQAKLTDAYRRAARELSGTLCPVGIAFQNARISNPGLHLFRSDGSHPSPAGTYLAACVFYAVLTGRSPVGLTSNAVGDHTGSQPASEWTRLSEDDAAFLQKIAWRSVEEDPSRDERYVAAR